MPTSGYTAAQRAALSFTALELAEPGRWREISVKRLSFTDIERSPLCQLYGSVTYGLRKLSIPPGDAAGLGFAAYDNQDAELLRMAWVLLLTTDDEDATPPP